VLTSAAHTQEGTNMKKLTGGLLVFLAIVLFSTQVAAGIRIGVLMFSGEARYIEAAKGARDKLKEMGFGEPKVSFTVDEAGANKARAAELVQKYVAAKFDLIIALGTSSTQAVVREIKDVPIVFSVVWDPVDAGIAKAWNHSGNNTTGVSSKIPMSKPMEILGNFARVKRLAVLYTPGEKNSESQLKDLQAVQTNKIKIVPVRITRVEDIGQLLPEVLRTVDALYITGSNLVNSQVSTIVDMAEKAVIITLTHLEDLVEKGVLFGVCVDSYRAGQLTGEKAAKILKGAKASAISIECVKKYDVILNMKSVKKGHFQVPTDFMKMVTKTIE
jgi:putative tryptophan/tyrosine transport system substrate-binding protein